MATSRKEKPKGAEVIHEIKEGVDTPQAVKEAETVDAVSLPELIEKDVDKSLKKLTSKDVIAGWKETYKVIPIVDLNDKAGIKLVEDGKKFIRKQRTGLEAAKIEIKAPFLKACKTIDGQYNELAGLIEAIEKPIDDELAKVKKWETEAEQARAKAEKERLDTRMAELQSHGLSLDRGYWTLGEIATDISTIAILPDKDYAALLERVKATAAIIAQQKAEAERLEAVRIAEEQAAREKLAADQQALADQQAAFLKQQQEFEDAQNALRLQKIKMRSERLEGLGLRFQTSTETFYLENSLGALVFTDLLIVKEVQDELFEIEVKRLQQAIAEVREQEREETTKAEQEAAELAEAQRVEQERQRDNINKRVPRLIEMGMQSTQESYVFPQKEIIGMGMEFLAECTDEQFETVIECRKEEIDAFTQEQATKEAERLADIEAAKPEIQKVREYIQFIMDADSPEIKEPRLSVIYQSLNKSIFSAIEACERSLDEIEKG